MEEPITQQRLRNQKLSEKFFIYKLSKITIYKSLLYDKK